MGRDLIIGMSATFLLWVGAVAYASSRLVWLNWHLYTRWNQIDRDTRVKMALWLAIPMMMFGIFWMRCVAFWGFALGYYISDFGILQSLAYLPVILVSLALALWWAFDRTYGGQRGDVLWCRLMWIGIGAGVTVSLVSWWF